MASGHRMRLYGWKPASRSLILYHLVWPLSVGGAPMTSAWLGDRSRGGRGGLRWCGEASGVKKAKILDSTGVMAK